MSAPNLQGPPRWAEGGFSSDEEQGCAELLRSWSPASTPDEVSRERVWRRLIAPHLAPTPWARSALGLGAVAAALAVLALVVFRGRASSGAATIESTVGRVEVARKTMPWSAARTGDSVWEASRIRTEKGGRVSLRVGSGALIDVGESSDVGLDSLGSAIFVRLTGGSVNVQLERGRQTLAIQTGVIRAESAEATFWVNEAASQVVVAVETGAVQLIEGSRRFVLSAGERWSSAPVRADVATDHAPPAPSPIARHPDAPVGPAIAPAARSASTDLDTRPIHRTRAVESPPAVTLRGPPGLLEPRPQTVALAEAPSIAVPTASPVPAPDRASAPAVEPSPTPSVAPPSAPAASPYREAVDLRRAGRVMEASQRLQSIVEAGAPEADLALYELARMRQRDLHDLSGALLAYQRYQRSFPNGPLIQEVSVSVVEIALKQGNKGGALSGAQEFMQRFPDSDRAPEVRLIHANLLREQGDCAGAEKEYQSVSASPLVEEDALYFRAWCLRQLNRDSEVRSILADLLARFPEGKHAAEARAALEGR